MVEETKAEFAIIFDDEKTSAEVRATFEAAFKEQIARDSVLHNTLLEKSQQDPEGELALRMQLLSMEDG